MELTSSMTGWLTSSDLAPFVSRVADLSVDRQIAIYHGRWFRGSSYQGPVQHAQARRVFRGLSTSQVSFALNRNDALLLLLAA